jgi:RND family efflux transporter MFP subunit
MIEPHIIDSKKHDLPVGRETLTPNNKQMKIKPVVLVLFLAILGGAIAFGAIPRILQQQELVGHTHSQLAEATSVSYVIASPSPALEEFTLPGSTQAIQDAPIYARVNGYLSKRFVDIGDLVHKGQIMAEIDTPELDQQVQGASSAVEQAKANLDNTVEAVKKAEADAVSAAANVQKAKTDLEYYTAELQRYKELVKQGAVSVEDHDTRLQAYNSGVATYDSLIAAQNSAKASVSSAKAAVHVAQAAMAAAQYQHDQYNATRQFKTVKAPFDGIVVRSPIDAGSLITAGSSTTDTLIFEIAQADVIRTYVYVPEQYIPYIHLNEEVRLNFQEYPGIDFIGKVTNVSGGVNLDSKSLQVEVHIPNYDHKLLPGMYAQAHFEAPSVVRLAVVPSTTVQTRADGLFVYTVDDQKRVHMHKLEIGRDLGGKVEALKGIAVGDKVIVNPSDDIQDGLLVNPVAAPIAPTNTDKPKK